MLYRLILDPRIRWAAISAAFLVIGILTGCQNNAGTNSGGGGGY